MPPEDQTMATGHENGQTDRQTDKTDLITILGTPPRAKLKFYNYAQFA